VDGAWGGVGGAQAGSGWTGFKNRIINGGMMIAQRGTSFAGLTNGSTAYITDRWFWQESGTSTAVQTASQDSSAPTGFVNSLKVLTTTAQASLASTNSYKFVQRIEGFNIADFGWGTANAQPVTLSFWVRSSLTGTFGGGLQNENADRYYIYSYTINVADTWEYKTVTIVGDTSGTWNTTNGNGIGCNFSFGTGSDYQGTAGSWGSTRLEAPTGQVNVAGTLNATFYITGAQLEKGSTATSFDYRPYSAELAMCQRYYYQATKTDGINNRPITIEVSTTGSTYYPVAILTSPVTMRATPTTAVLGTVNFLNASFASMTSVNNGAKYQITASTSGGRAYALSDVTGSGYSLNSEL
jgi:hypothetical protein